MQNYNKLKKVKQMKKTIAMLMGHSSGTMDIMRTDIYNAIKDNTLDLYKPNEGEYEILRIKYPY